MLRHCLSHLFSSLFFQWVCVCSLTLQPNRRLRLAQSICIHAIYNLWHKNALNRLQSYRTTSSVMVKWTRVNYTKYWIIQTSMIELARNSKSLQWSMKTTANRLTSTKCWVFHYFISNLLGEPNWQRLILQLLEVLVRTFSLFLTLALALSRLNVVHGLASVFG